MRAPCLFLVSCLAIVTTPARAADPAAVAATAKKLGNSRLDSSREFPAEGQIIEREGLVASFVGGRFQPIVRDDGRVVGLVFLGEGTLQAGVPAGVETEAWQRGTASSPLMQSFSAAYLRFSDGTLSDLQGERPWTPSGDLDGAGFRIHDGRGALLQHPHWHRQTPDLGIDVLWDLFGGGSVGGHLWADFRVGEGRWLSYFTNPRGGLMQEERTAWFTVNGRGDSPPELHILSSFGEVPDQGRTYDVRRTHVDATLLGSPSAPRSLVDGSFRVDLEIVSLVAGLRVIVLELDHERPLCREESEIGPLQLKSALDPGGTILATAQIGSRLLVVLPSSLARGGATTIQLGYEGAVTQGVPFQSGGDVLFSELGPWAWYPRNPRPDRFASKVTAHLPRYVSAIAPGALVEETLGTDGWTFRYEEAGGVRSLFLVVGDYVHTPTVGQGNSPQVLAWLPRPLQKNLATATEGARAELGFVQGLWGPYPYSTLHVVSSGPFPAANWNLAGGAQAGSWTCVPPGITHAYEGFVEGASGIVFDNEPTTAPAWDVIESRVIGNLLGNDAASRRWGTMASFARQWWGHLVLPRSYRDAWIPESIASITANAYLQASQGRSFLGQRIELIRGAMLDGLANSPPVAVGPRLGRDWPMQVWGRGTLWFYQVLTHLGANAATTVWRDVLSRSSGKGVDLAVLLESLGSVAPPDLIDALRALAASTDLPSVEFVNQLDAEGKLKGLLFHRSGAELAIPLQVEIFLPGGGTTMQSVLLQDEWTRFVPAIDGRPKKLEVDPLGVAFARSVTKARKLTPPAGLN